MHDHMRIVRRITRQRADGHTVRTTYLYNALCKAMKAGAVIEPSIIADGMTSAAAFALEADMIANAPAGQLWNRASGGLGGTSESAKAQWADPATRERMQKSLAQPHVAAARSAGNKARWSNPANRKQHSDFVRSLHDDPAYTARATAAIKAAWSQQKRDDKAVEMAERMKCPDRRETSRVTGVKNWADPEKRASTIAKMKARCLDPEVRANRARAAHIGWAKRRAESV